MLLYHCIDDFWVRLRTFLPSSRVIKAVSFCRFLPAVKIAIFQEYFVLFGNRIWPFIDFIGFVYRGSKPCGIKMSFLGSTVFRLAILDLLQILIAFRNHFYQKRVQIFFFYYNMLYTDICVIFFSRSRNNMQRQFYSTQRHKTNMTQIRWRVEWRRVIGQRNDAVS